MALGRTNEAITGDNTEDKVAYEGIVYFDIRFTVITPGKERIKLIINIEAQKNFYPGYDLITRGIYYGARMISSQKGREFIGMSVVIICLGDSEKGFQKENSEYRKLLDLLTMISSHKIPVKQKLMTLEQDYHIATTRELKEGLSSMCNWSEGVIERIEKEVLEKVTNEVTEKVTNEVTLKNNRNAIANMMKRLQLSFEEACDILQVNPEDYAELKLAQE